VKNIDAQYKKQMGQAIESAARLLKEIYMALLFTSGLTIGEAMEQLLRELKRVRQTTRAMRSS